MEPKYKTGDYIVITGNCKPNMINRICRITGVHGDCYMVNMYPNNPEPPHEMLRPWSIVKCDSGSYLQKAMTILYADANS